MSNLGRDISLKKEHHIRYLNRFLDFMPTACEDQESMRLTLVFFILQGLDILNALDRINTEKKKEIIDWVYSMQIEPSENDEDLCRCGFQGASVFNLPKSEIGNEGSLLKKYQCCSLPMNYSALLILIILGDDLSRVNKKPLLEGVKALQQENGCFSTHEGGESDMRFVYCAAAVCYILNDWSAIDKEKMTSFIYQSMGYDFGLGQGPFLESHGGSTYCGIAALVLMEELYNCFSPKEISMLKRWCLFRQESGFHGRPNKPDDTCYSFWIGATLKLLEAFDLVNAEENRNYILCNQGQFTGGFSKWTDLTPDPLHTCFGLSGLSLMKEESLLEIFPALNITQRAYKHLQKLHAEDRD